ncbi:MAG: hypothetical protein CVT95_11195 [Bacteroidetes bacterium HGW-Bacteroidetes-12]|nr:MAG: hypothetical protein CVT95_11195 [Bacteroidetes bacterium HGW-Bacteroidetes-12]
MKIPFTIEEFLNVFKSYNQSVFPIQIAFYLIAFIVIYLLYKPVYNNGKIISAVLSFFWLWIGIVYQLIFFTSINKAAYLFGILFIIQGILFFFYGVVKGNISFKYRQNIFNYIGILLILYALIVYPILGYYLGHKYPSSPTFGLPCPTVIFTFGLLLFLNRKISVFIIIIPLLWSIVGFGAALNLSIYEDYGLLLSGVLGFVLILLNNKSLNVKTV